MQGEALELLAWKWEGLKRVLQVYGAELLLFLPLAVMFGPAHVGCGSSQCGEICSGDSPIPCCCCRALGRYLLYTQRKRLLVSLFTLYWLITLWMWPPPFIFILGFDSVQFLPETGLAESTSIILGESVASFLLFFIVLTHVSFAASAFLQNMFCSWLHWSNIVYNCQE